MRSCTLGKHLDDQTSIVARLQSLLGRTLRTDRDFAAEIGSIRAADTARMLRPYQPISIRFTWRRASGFFARITVSTPFLNVAFTFSGSTESPMTIWRSNAPAQRSL